MLWQEKLILKAGILDLCKGGGRHVAYLQNGPTIDTVDVDDGDQRYKYRGYDMMSSIPTVDILDAHPEKVDELTPDDLFNAYYSLYPDMKKYVNTDSRKREYDPRKVDKNFYEVMLLNNIKNIIDSNRKYYYDSKRSSYVEGKSTLSSVILEALRDVGEQRGYDEYIKRRKEVLKWIDRALGYY